MPRAEVQHIVATLGTRIRAARRAQGLSQEELARRAGCSRRTLMRLEQGKWSPTIELVIDLAHALGESLTELLEERPAAELPSKRPTGSEIQQRRLAEAIALLSPNSRRKLLEYARLLALSERWRGRPRTRIS